tara:strand:+ start:139 stop:1044 length:906 start_codon:yes stop_codon:yes gene_type:complete
MKQTHLIITALLFIFPVLVFSQGNTDQIEPDSTGQQVEIITRDGNEYIGEIVSENEQEIVLKTPSDITLTIPKNKILKRNEFSGKVVEGKLFRPDPNKSMYMFAPSAYPIGDQKSYCRDFCLFFPSFNGGFGNNISVQMGAFWFPTAPIDQIPLVGSVKMSLPSDVDAQFAGGIMYIRFPGNDFRSSTGMGFTFVTGTIGDNFTHASATLGWGYTQFEGDWEFMDDPIFVLAGNYRMSENFALVFEGWFTPEKTIIDDMAPKMVSIRFFGKRFSFDFGGLYLFPEQEGLPFPLINFTYYYN